jgi:transposase-like protein
MIKSRSSSSAPAGYRFPSEVIAVAVRWYLRYGLSYRDVEELLAERGITVDHVTIYRWVQRSRRSSSTPPGQLATPWVIGGSWTRCATRRWCAVRRWKPKEV